MTATITGMGRDGWTTLLGRTVANFAPRDAAPEQPATAQKVQYTAPFPAGPLPFILPPSAVPGSPENKDLVRSTIKELQAVGEAIGNVFTSRKHDKDDQDEYQERQRRPPPGSKPIDETPWSGDHKKIKEGITAGSTDDVRISPDDEVWSKNPDGTWTNHGPARNLTGSDRPTGRRGKDRSEWWGS